MNKKSTTVASDGPHPVDTHVGQRVRMRRSLVGMSQEKMAESLGITFQQVQKYERGTNRVSASKLYLISKILSVPVAYFFDNFENKGTSPAYGFADNAQEALDETDIMTSKETLDLLRVYYSIKDQDARKKLASMIKSVAETMK